MFDKKEVSTEPEEVVSVIRQAIESQGFKYDYNPQTKIFKTLFRGDDHDILTTIMVTDAVIRFRCTLDGKAFKSNFQDVVWELNKINMEMLSGKFVLDTRDGSIYFATSVPYRIAVVTVDFILRYTRAVVEVFDDYDGRLKEIAEKQ